MYAGPLLDVHGDLCTAAVTTSGVISINPPTLLPFVSLAGQQQQGNDGS